MLLMGKLYTKGKMCFTEIVFHRKATLALVLATTACYVRVYIRAFGFIFIDIVHLGVILDLPKHFQC